MANAIDIDEGIVWKRTGKPPRQTPLRVTDINRDPDLVEIVLDGPKGGEYGLVVERDGAVRYWFNSPNDGRINHGENLSWWAPVPADRMPTPAEPAT